MKVCILLSNGYEEVEALTVVDWLRRAEIEVDMVATEGELLTTGDHGIQIKADYLIEDIDYDSYDMVITPGGLPGTNALSENDKVIDLIQKQHAKGKYVASICASPMVLEKAGILNDAEGTIYPGLEEEVNFKKYHDKIVVVDEESSLITSQGPATATYFALEIIKVLKGEEAYDEVFEGLLLDRVENYIKEK